MSQNSAISRRTLTKGAAWSLPAVVAASAVPAMAASGSSDYQFSGSYYAKYTVGADGSGCPSGKGQLQSLNIDTRQQQGGLKGFGVVALNGAAQTTATVTDFAISYAFPQGMISFMQRQDAVMYSGPTQSTTTINGAAYDVFTFTWQGSSSSTTGTSFSGSMMTANASVKSSYCANAVNPGETYYFRPSGSWSTATGAGGTFPDTWLSTTMTIS